MSFYICHCGNTSEPHNFRHRYEKVAKVTRNIDADCNEYYSLNADNFPTKIGTRCSKSECSSDISIHGTEILGHKYEPKNYTYREVKLTLPENAQCNRSKCKSLKEHKDVMTHHFTTKVIIENLNETDIVTITDPKDEDIKIIWK